MEKYSNMHGFTLVRTTDCPEQSATLVEYVHDGTGAPLFYLDRPDENMTFAIGFRTVPTDDTGVFHILEHSVLCGSKQFPVKDPRKWKWLYPCRSVSVHHLPLQFSEEMFHRGWV